MTAKGNQMCQARRNAHAKAAKAAGPHADKEEGHACQDCMRAVWSALAACLALRSHLTPWLLGSCGMTARLQIWCLTAWADAGCEECRQRPLVPQVKLVWLPRIWGTVAGCLKGW